MKLLFIILYKSLIRNNTINHNQLPLAEEREGERESRMENLLRWRQVGKMAHCLSKCQSVPLVMRSFWGRCFCKNGRQ